MIAGRMKYRITLLKHIETTDRMGAAVDTYVETATIWAERVKISGNRSEEVGEHFPDYQVEFNIRDAHVVSENWHLQQLGGYLYNIDSVIPNIDRGMLTLRCSRVNE